MAKSKGQRIFEVYDQLPDGAKKHTNKIIRLGAKVSRRVVDREQIERRGKAHVAKVRRMIAKRIPTKR